MARGFTPRAWTPTDPLPPRDVPATRRPPPSHASDTVRRSLSAPVPQRPPCDASRLATVPPIRPAGVTGQPQPRDVFYIGWTVPLVKRFQCASRAPGPGGCLPGGERPWVAPIEYVILVVGHGAFDTGRRPPVGQAACPAAVRPLSKDTLSHPVRNVSVPTREENLPCSMPDDAPSECTRAHARRKRWHGWTPCRT